MLCKIIKSPSRSRRPPQTTPFRDTSIPPKAHNAAATSTQFSPKAARSPESSPEAARRETISLETCPKNAGVCAPPNRYTFDQKSHAKCNGILGIRLKNKEIKWKTLVYAAKPTKTDPKGFQQLKIHNFPQKWSWSPPEPQIYKNRILARDLCRKYGILSAAEGNKHIVAMQHY